MSADNVDTVTELESAIIGSNSKDDNDDGRTTVKGMSFSYFMHDYTRRYRKISKVKFGGRNTSGMCAKQPWDYLPWIRQTWVRTMNHQQ